MNLHVTRVLAWIFLPALFLFPSISLAQTNCDEGETEIVVEISPDEWPNEISWTLLVDGELIAEGGSNSDTLCVVMDDEFPCFEFTIYDSYGDGLNEPGFYNIYLDGELSGGGSGDYGYSDTVTFDCAPGTTCNDAVELGQPSEEGDMIDQPVANFWYSFTPEANGMYLFSSCETGCDTRLYIYEYCSMSNFEDDNTGTIYYDDDQGGCGDEATLTVLLEGGITYWIRWASFEGCDGPWQWEHAFMGPPEGCTDPVACNYNPNAELDNGSCVYPGDPECTGPDLIVVEEAIVNSIYATNMQVDESDCYITEGCLNGFGNREIVRFTTHIKNIGDLDYYIGSPSSDNAQFEWGDCHNHWHHNGYAKYDLFTLDGEYIPIGFKNGFCVMDLECSDGGTAQYGCSTMGISAHCGDIYGSGLSCQWIDVTDVPDGTYFLVVRANWEYIPDALGRHENDYNNNYAAVCVNFDRSLGELDVNVYDDCSPFYDCEGTLFGQAVVDCNGDCNGEALVGDLDYNGAQEYTDAVAYVEGILGDDIAVAPCTDIDQDDNITVSDAALMSRCQFWNEAHEHPDSTGVHEKCDFPVTEIINYYDTVHFKIGNIDWNQGYVDVHVLNPNNRIVGYQIEFSGIEISQAISLADVVNYPIEPSFVPGGSEVIGLSYSGESMMKFYEWTPLLRLYWINVDEEVCIQNVVDVVNDDYHNTLIDIEDACVSEVHNEEIANTQVTVVPNPVTANSTISFSNPTREAMMLQIIDAQGKLVRVESTTGNTHVIEKGNLRAGAYFFRLTGSQSTPLTGRFDIK